MITIDELPFRFVEYDGFRKFMIICCPDFRIPCRKTIRRDDIGAKLAECLEEWGLKNVFTVTLDNAFANDVACTFLKDKLETWGTIFMNGRYLHVRCVSHIVNLVVNDGMNEIGMSVKRVREAVRWVRSYGS
ncbi:Putative AC transposase [Linum perenne]